MAERRLPVIERLVLTKRLRILRHRATRWFQPPVRTGRPEEREVTQPHLRALSLGGNLDSAT